MPILQHLKQTYWLRTLYVCYKLLNYFSSQTCDRCSTSPLSRCSCHTCTKSENRIS